MLIQGPVLVQRLYTGTVLDADTVSGGAKAHYGSTERKSGQKPKKLKSSYNGVVSFIQQLNALLSRFKLVWR